MARLAAGFLILSGIAALTYQVTWVRLIGFSMGSTSASVSTVLAAFFIGLAGGSYFAEKITRHHIQSLKPYIILELVIGLTGLALLPILLNLNTLLALAPTLAPYLAFKFSVALLLLFIPTLCMGATFPIMAAILIRSEREVGNRIGQLYSLNTFGAVFGAIGSGFIFIPKMGLDGAIYLAVSLNLTIVGVGWWSLKRIKLPAFEPASTPDQNTVANNNQTHPHSSAAATPASILALSVLALTGFTSIATEVGWTKYLSIVTGTTIYGFAAILGIFLFGIAAGAWFIRQHIERIQQPIRWLAFALIGLGALLLLTRTALSFVPTIYENINALSIAPLIKQGLTYGIVAGLLLPATFLLGAIFPVNLKLYCGSLRGVQTRIGKAYAINMLASIGGSIVAGFWLIPVYGTDTLLLSMALMLLVTPLIFAFFFSQNRQRLALITGSLILMASSYFLPPIDYKNLISSVGYDFDEDVLAGKTPEYLFLKEGRMGVISLVTYDQKSIKVQNNGLNESLIDLYNPNNALIVESLLAYIPYFLHDNPQNAFVVGYGGGITTRAFTYTDLSAIQVVELEPVVVEAVRSLENGPALALDDPRVQINFNDARNHLLIDPQKYDLITAQPSHPWLAGAANVFTQEFFDIVKSRLNEGGIYSQWVNLFRMDVTTLKAIIKAYYNVFPEGLMLANLSSGDLILIGASHPLVFDFDQVATRVAQQPKIRANLTHFNANKPIDLLWYFGLSRDEALQAAGDSIPNRDINILSEVRLSALLDRPSGDENPYPFLRRHSHYDLIPYLKPQEAKQRLYEIAEYFLIWDAPVSVEKIIKQLNTLDPSWSQTLQHELFTWKLDVARATQWYINHQAKLPDLAHLHQAKLYADEQAYVLANVVIERINDNTLRRTGLAYLLYVQSDWQSLSELIPQSKAERIWQLIGLSQYDLKAAGKQLASIMTLENRNIHQIQTVIAYYAHTHQTKNFYAWQRHLTTILDRHTRRYTQLAKRAIEQKNLIWAARLIKKVKYLNPKNEVLYELQQRYDKAQLTTG